MLRITIFLFCSWSFFSLSAQQAIGKPKGLLWEISGNGIARPGYLYGTMHVPEKMAFNLSDSFFIVLKQVDMVALETDHDQWQAFTETLNDWGGEIFGLSGLGTDRNFMSTQMDLYREAFQFSLPDNQLLGAVLSSKPRMTNEFLFRSNQYRQDYEEDTYLDLFIFQAGRKLGKKVVGLETMEGSYEAYVRAQLPDDEEDDSRPDRYHAGIGPRATLEDAYRDQDLALIDSLNKMMQPGKNFQRWMQDERNIIMTSRIDSILQSGTALFSAVGAAHLPGDQGLLQSLQRKGYGLRPVQFSNQHSKKEKEAIEALHHPVHFSTQWAPDSSWSAEAPGMFYQTADAQGLTQHLHADMGNGAFYAVYRLRTFGAWYGQSPEYIAQRIDSLIYEKIPGKIQERSRLTQPYPGHAIKTRTRRGDIIRYRVFVTPMDVFVFTTGGNGDYASGEEGDRFLNSIRFYAPPANKSAQHTVLRPPEGGFQITFPVAPAIDTVNTAGDYHYLAVAADRADSTIFLFARVEYHDWKYIEEDTFELNMLAETIAARFTETPPTVSLSRLTTYPTADFSFRSDRDSAQYHLRLVIDGPRYYLLGCRNSSSEQTEQFFSGFSIEPFEYPDGWALVSDSTGMFRVRVPVKADLPTHPFLVRLRKIVADAFQKNRTSAGYFSKPEKVYQRILDLPVQGEEVSVKVTPFSAVQGIPEVDSFQQFWRKLLTNNYKLRLKSSHWERPDTGLMTGNFLVTDTNSTRAIRTKVLVTPGQVYMISATVHTEQPESAFIRSIFDDFIPTDTTQGALSFGHRDLQYLENLYAPDSLVRAQAFNALGSTWERHVLPSDFPAFRAAILHPGFKRLPFTQRNNLFIALGFFSSDGAAALVGDLLRQYPDSVRYRQALLVALARMKTAAAYQGLLDQLLNHPTYLMEGDASTLFGIVTDTLELAAGWFPDALALAARDDYRNFIYHLLDKLLEKDLVQPKVLVRLQPALIRESTIWLSKLQYEAEWRADPDNGDMYRFGQYDNYDNGPSGHLQHQLRILAPFISRNKSVQEVFRLAMQCSSPNIRILANCLMLRYKRPVDRAALEQLAADDNTRIHLYRQLAAFGRLDAYPPGLPVDTVALVQSLLVSKVNSSPANEVPDSVRFISQHRFTYAGEPAVLYFFELKEKKAPAWRLAYILVPYNARMFGVRSGKKGDDDGETFQHSSLYDPEAKVLPEMTDAEKAEFIRKKLSESRFVTRERYREKDRYDY